MARYIVTLSESVYYQVTVEAEDEAHAIELAHEAHEDGSDYEIDSGGTEVESVELERFEGKGF